MSSEPDLGNRVSKTKQEKAHLKWWSLNISAARVEWGGRYRPTTRAVAVSFRGYLGVGDINTHLRAKQRLTLITKPRSCWRKGLTEEIVWLGAEAEF